MTRYRQPALQLALAVALLATGLTGCKKGADSKMEEPQKNASTPAPGQTPAPAGQAAQGGAQPAGMPPAGMPPGGMPPAGMPPGGMSSHSPAEAAPLDPDKVPEVVARVNGQEIKKADLIQAAGNMQMQYAQQGIRPPQDTGFYKQVLNSLIARTLLTQEANAEHVTVTDAEVEQQMTALRSQAPSPEAFKQALAANKLTEDGLRQKIRKEGAVQKFVQTKVLANVTVSDQQAKDFYDKNPDKMKKPERVHARHILIHVDANAPAADKEKAKAKAEDLLKKIKGGEDFAKLASENSDDPGSKPRGGDLGWFARGQMVPAFDAAAFALDKPNDVSPVIQTQFGYHIIQLVGKEAASTAPFEMVKPQIVDFLKKQQTEQVLEAHVQGLRAKGKVETFI